MAKDQYTTKITIPLAEARRWKAAAEVSGRTLPNWIIHTCKLATRRAAVTQDAVTEIRDRREVRANSWRSPKTIAQGRLASAIRSGKIMRPSECSKCGSRRNIEGHHHKGYDPRYWLDVEWLCAKCHNRLHRAERQLLIAGLRTADEQSLARLRLVLDQTRGSIRETAQQLGVGLRTLYDLGRDSPAVGELLKKHGMGRSGAAAVARKSRGNTGG